MVEAQFVDEPGALLGRAGNADDGARTFYAGQLSHNRAGGPGRPRHHHRVTRSGLTDVEEPEVGGHPGDPEDPDGNRGIHTRGQDGQGGLAFIGQSELLPAEHAEDQVARAGSARSGSPPPPPLLRCAPPRRCRWVGDSPAHRPSRCGWWDRWSSTGPAPAPVPRPARGQGPSRRSGGSPRRPGLGGGSRAGCVGRCRSRLHSSRPSGREGGRWSDHRSQRIRRSSRSLASVNGG